MKKKTQARWERQLPFSGKQLEKSQKGSEANTGEHFKGGICTLRLPGSRQHAELGGLIPSFSTKWKKAAGALAWFWGVPRGAKSVWQVFNACISNVRLLAPFKQW